MDVTEISECQIQQDGSGLVVCSCLKLFGKGRGCFPMSESLLPAGFACEEGNALACVFVG